MSDTPDPPTVLDASVTVKLVLIEDRTRVAWRLYRDAVREDRPLVAPTLLPDEVTNAIYRQRRRELITEPVADDAVAQLARLDVHLLSPPDLGQEAHAFAKRHRLGAIYDSLYVVLARDLGADLWTDDLRLLHAVAPAAPWVRWLGAYP